jgi:hypothetical protein
MPIMIWFSLAEENAALDPALNQKNPLNAGIKTSSEKLN